ncbi:MAG: hypothetical protein IH963_05295 [Chloroflexi bacterium]|nr:hypothetical protein [Chloroflexota bacterium]
MRKRFGAVMFLLLAGALLTAVACGGSPTAPLPTQPPPTGNPAEGAPPDPTEAPDTIETPAPIEDTALVVPAVPGGEYTLKITSGLPNGCARFNGYKVERDYNGFAVEVTNLMPDPKDLVACTMVYGYHESEVPLGSGLDAGQTYTVTINGDLAIFFTAQDETRVGMVEKESPIDNVEVEEADGGYLLTVVSTLPKGSSCSRFNGYQINRRFRDSIEVTLTHLEVTDDYLGACTADLPFVVTVIPLGSGFEGGRTYMVSVNGEETAFTAR